MSIKIRKNLLATIAGVRKLNVGGCVEESDFTKAIGSCVASIGRQKIVVVGIHCRDSVVDHILEELSEIRMD